MTVRIPEHVTVDEDKGTAACTVCHMDVTVPGSTFGPISRETFLSTFVIQHAVHGRRGQPTGLGRGGRATPEAVAVLRQ